MLAVNKPVFCVIILTVNNNRSEKVSVLTFAFNKINDILPQLVTVIDTLGIRPLIFRYDKYSVFFKLEIVSDFLELRLNIFSHTNILHGCLLRVRVPAITILPS